MAGVLPAWGSVLAVVAHPDDESFGLGAILDASAGCGDQGRGTLPDPGGGPDAARSPRRAHVGSRGWAGRGWRRARGDPHHAAVPPV